MLSNSTTKISVSITNTTSCWTKKSLLSFRKKKNVIWHAYLRHVDNFCGRDDLDALTNQTTPNVIPQI